MKIPKHAKRVFKGIIFDVYQWQQKMFDGTSETFEAIKRESTVIVIATVKNKVIILKQKQPGTKWFYSLTAGRMDVAGETPKHAALRELREETGYEPGNIKLWYKANDPSRKIDHDIFIFLANNCKKVTRQKLDAGEKIQVKLISFEALLSMSHKEDFIEGEIKKHLIKAKNDKKYLKNFKKLIFG